MFSSSRMTKYRSRIYSKRRSRTLRAVMWDGMHYCVLRLYLTFKLGTVTYNRLCAALAANNSSMLPTAAGSC
jgi:hypothetical protein